VQVRARRCVSGVGGSSAGFRIQIEPAAGRFRNGRAGKRICQRSEER
jgi:hypothetical protein